MDEDTEVAALQARLVAEGRLRPAKDPGCLLKVESVDRGISAAQIDDAISELRDDRT